MGEVRQIVDCQVLQLLERPRPDEYLPDILRELDVFDAIEHAVSRRREEVVKERRRRTVAVGICCEVGRIQPGDIREGVLVILDAVDKGEGQRAHREVGIGCTAL